VIQAYRFALDRTPGQDVVLRSHCGGQRYAFNWGLALVTAVMEQRKAEASCGIPADQLTPSLSWSGYSLRKLRNQAKTTVVSDKRHGLSCRFTTGGFGLPAADRRHVKLPRIGTLRTLESTRKLARHLARGTARIRSATVSHRAGRWKVSFSVEIIRGDPAPIRPGSVVGVHLGIKSLAVLSTGEVIANPKHLEIAQRQLRRLQRQAARRRDRIAVPGRSPRRGGARPRPASPACTPPWPTPAATACTSSRPAWCVSTV
jgi:putative transposase